MKMELNGKPVSFNLVRGNLREHISKLTGKPVDEIPNTIVKYDSKTNTVLVDKTVDENYAMYAAFHECICCGHKKNLAPKTTDPKKRCGLIDRMVIRTMPKEKREGYIEQRIEMFGALIKLGLNPSLDKQFETSINILRSTQ